MFECSLDFDVLLIINNTLTVNVLLMCTMWFDSIS